MPATQSQVAQPTGHNTRLAFHTAFRYPGRDTGLGEYKGPGLLHQGLALGNLVVTLALGGTGLGGRVAQGEGRVAHPCRGWHRGTGLCISGHDTASAGAAVVPQMYHRKTHTHPTKDPASQCQDLWIQPRAPFP